jgi:hypothetical protein
MRLLKGGRAGTCSDPGGTLLRRAASGCGIPSALKVRSWVISRVTGDGCRLGSSTQRRSPRETITRDADLEAPGERMPDASLIHGMPPVAPLAGFSS